MNGIIEYNEKGLPMCEECGQYYHRVLSHVRQKHNLSAKQYKIKYGLDLSKGICSKSSSEKTRVKTKKNYNLVIAQNLLINGKQTRFKQGHKGRTIEQVSEMSRLRLINNFKNKKI
jgi:hypothetical protein|tara:strand:- start:5683 stop:6030 length:348 start_codon:yes stop_codon:yes gene_type:complete